MVNDQQIGYHPKTTYKSSLKYNTVRTINHHTDLPIKICTFEK